MTCMTQTTKDTLTVTTTTTTRDQDYNVLDVGIHVEETVNLSKETFHFGTGGNSDFNLASFTFDAASSISDLADPTSLLTGINLPNIASQQIFNGLEESINGKIDDKASALDTLKNGLEILDTLSDIQDIAEHLENSNILEKEDNQKQLQNSEEKQEQENSTLEEKLLHELKEKIATAKAYGISNVIVKASAIDKTTGQEIVIEEFIGNTEIIADINTKIEISNKSANNFSQSSSMERDTQIDSTTQKNTSSNKLRDASFSERDAKIELLKKALLEDTNQNEFAMTALAA